MTVGMSTVGVPDNSGPLLDDLSKEERGAYLEERHSFTIYFIKQYLIKFFILIMIN